MTSDQLKEIVRWFHDYTADFLKDTRILLSVRLKIKHVERVVIEMEALTRALGLEDDDRRIGLAVAQLHDLGRFPQVRFYYSMNDCTTVDHAELGLKVIREFKVLSRLEEQERRLIETAILNHNRLTIEEGLDSRALMYCRLIRDADKIDIWRLILEADLSGSEGEMSAVFLGLPDLPTWTPKLLADIREGRLARLEDVHTRNDFRLLAMAWVYDLHLNASYRAVYERKFLEGFAARLPDSPEIRSTVRILISHVRHRAG